MKATLFILGGIVAAFAFCAVVIAILQLLKWLFGEVWGFAVFSLTLMALGGGTFGWLVYRIRNPR